MEKEKQKEKEQKEGEGEDYSVDRTRHDTWPGTAAPPLYLRASTAVIDATVRPARAASFSMYPGECA